jgi:hypothetical protein
VPPVKVVPAKLLKPPVRLTVPVWTCTVPELVKAT